MSEPRRLHALSIDVEDWFHPELVRSRVAAGACVPLAHGATQPILALLERYLSETPDPARGWALAAITGDLSIPSVKPAMIRQMTAERVDPVLFGAADRHATVKTKDRRTAFELAITRGALERDRPVLGICGGQQLLNVVLGGSLIQHIPDVLPGALAGLDGVLKRHASQNLLRAGRQALGRQQGAFHGGDDIGGVTVPAVFLHHGQKSVFIGQGLLHFGFAVGDELKQVRVGF